MSSSLVIGKFMPLHKGHKYLLDTALQATEGYLHVIICTKKDDPIPLLERMDWIDEITNFDKTIIHTLAWDGVDPEDTSAWVDLTRKLIGVENLEEISTVYSSEDYGPKYAEGLGLKHIMIDRERILYPIHAHDILEDVWANWYWLIPETYNYFAFRAVVVGAESTGTTTLAKALADYYKTVWVPELGRVLAEGMQHSRYGEWNKDDFEYLLYAQRDLAEQLGYKANKIIIGDTDHLATEVWYTRYMNVSASPLRTKEWWPLDHPDLYIVTDDDIPFVQDGTRDGEHIRSAMTQTFIKKTAETNVPTLIVTGSVDERLSASINLIDEMMGKKWQPKKSETR